MTDEPRCPAHPAESAIAACIDCGRWVCADCRRVGVDGLGRCAECVASTAPDPQQQADPRTGDPADRRASAEAPAHAAPPATRSPRDEATEARITDVQTDGPAPVAWERPDHNSDVRAFLLTAREALTGPARYMSRVPWVRGDLRTPLIFAVLAGVLGQLGLLLITRFVGPPAGMSGATAGLADLPPGGALATVPFLPLMVTASIFAGSWLAHAMLRLSGDPPRPYEATFRIYAYAEVSSLLLLVPFVGPYAARFGFVFLLLTGFRIAQGAGFSVSLLAMAPSIVLMWVLV